MGKHYTKEVKWGAVKMHCEDGVITEEVLKKYGIKSRRRFLVWCAEYREGGYEHIGYKRKGRAVKTKKYNNPEERIKELEMEVELLKAFLYE
jgi:transposase-like protein